MSRIITAFIVLFALSSAGIANNQDEPENQKKSKTIYGAYFMFNIDAPFIESTEFNKMLLNNNLVETNFPPTLFGFSLHQQFGRMHFTFGHTENTNNVSQKTFNTSSSIKHNHIQLGFDIINKSRFSVAPYAGWRKSIISHQISENIDVTDIEQFVNADIDYKELIQKQNFIDLGLSISRQKFFRLNIRSGFLIPLMQEQWELNNQPPVPLNTNFFKQQFYISFGIGAGFIFSRKGNLKKIGEMLEDLEIEYNDYEVEEDVYENDSEPDENSEDSEDELIFDEI
jgi:hypothetical protein